MMDSMPDRDLVLIGAGHTHLHVIRKWRMRPLPGVQLTLVSSFSQATYSGMLPGTLAGLYQPDEMKIDLVRYAAGTGIRLIVAPAVGLTINGPPDRPFHVQFSDRPPIPFDVVSIGIGSVPSHAEVWRDQPRVLSIKPMATFLSRLESAVEKYQRPNHSFRCVVVGGGAAGVEITFCLQQWLKTRNIEHSMVLVEGGRHLLAGYNRRMIQQVRREFEQRQITIQGGCRVSEIQKQCGEGPEPPVILTLTPQDLTAKDLDPSTAENSDPQAYLGSPTVKSLPADLVIWATQACPPDVLRDFRVPQSPDGFLAVYKTLQSTSNLPIFAVGDTASFVDLKVPKAGVYAVREGPILWKNLQRILSGRALVEYQPQSGFLSLLSSGDHRAFLQYGGWTHYGPLAWWLKDRIDRKFMGMYQEYQPPRQIPMTAVGKGQKADSIGRLQMQCGGCGSKAGANCLAVALDRIREQYPAHTAALIQSDDAHIIPPGQTRPDVLSVDYFRSFLNEPYLIGRVAAIHSLGDIWAKGADAIGAQALVTVPYGSERQQSELLFQILAGAMQEFQRYDIQLWGGHTMQGHELEVGFSVCGTLDGRLPWRKNGLLPGDALILTKSLGTGILLAALPQARCKADWYDELIANLVQGTRQAALVGRGFTVHAATDVTGFGLAGHLLEMLRTNRHAACLDWSTLSKMLLPGVKELVEQGVESSLAPRNRATFESSVCYTLPHDADRTLIESVLIDPQTSGGMLLGVPISEVEPLISAMHSAGVCARQIGVVTNDCKTPNRTLIDVKALSQSQR